MVGNIVYVSLIFFATLPSYRVRVKYWRKSSSEGGVEGYLCENIGEIIFINIGEGEGGVVENIEYIY